MVYDVMETDIAGTLVLAGDERGLRHIDFKEGKHQTSVADSWKRDPAFLAPVRKHLESYFAGELRRFDLRLAPRGTEFQKKVWECLKEIPYGELVTYRWVAERIGAPTAVRAVGGANGRNPLSIVVPCHRVIGSDGALTGFGGGLPIKQRLIELENPSADFKKGPTQLSMF